MTFLAGVLEGQYEISEYNPGNAVLPPAMARVARLASGDFDGFACSVAPELKERQQAAAEDLGATVLGKPFARRGSTLVLIPADKVEQFHEPEDPTSLNPTDVGNALLQHLFSEQDN